MLRKYASRKKHQKQNKQKKYSETDAKRYKGGESEFILDPPQLEEGSATSLVKIFLIVAVF